MTRHWTAHLRRAALWAVPGILLAALIWTLVPRGGVEPVTPPALPALPGGQVRSAPAASGGAPASPPTEGDSSGAPSAANADARANDAAAPSTAAAAAAPARTAAVAPGGAAGGAAGEIKLGNLVGTDDKGHMRWQIVADDMMLQQPQQTVLLKRVRATFFSADGTRMLLNGDRGTYDTRSRQITVGGSVHGVTSGGRELFADNVSYLPQSRQVEGEGHVRVIEERVITFADRMISDLRLGQTRFFGNVRITLR